MCTGGNYVLNWIIRRFFLFRWCLHTSLPIEAAPGAKRQSQGGSAEVFLGRRVHCAEPELLPVFMKWLFHRRPVPWENLSVSVHGHIVFFVLSRREKLLKCFLFIHLFYSFFVMQTYWNFCMRYEKVKAVF